MKIKSKTLLLLSCFSMSFLGGLVSSCHDDEQRPVVPEKVQITVNDLHNSWIGEYEGWDSLMHVKTRIQKQLVLNADSTYTNTIGGIVFMPNASNKPQLFEKEAGTYTVTLKDTICVFTFTAKYDSIVDFGRGQLVGYEHKHCHDMKGEEYDLEHYTQTLSVSNAKEQGTFRLLAVDSTLFSLDGKGTPILYYMNVERKEP